MLPLSYYLVILSLHLMGYMASSHPLCDMVESLELSNQNKGYHALNDWSCVDNEPIDDYCEWTGITCKNNIITGIDISSKEVIGSLPQSICQLTSLVTFDIESNHITGKLPNCFSELNQLKDFRMFSNNISGTIPHDLFLLTKLRDIYFYTNRMTGACSNPFRTSTQYSA